MKLFHNTFPTLVIAIVALTSFVSSHTPHRRQTPLSDFPQYFRAAQYAQAAACHPKLGQHVGNATVVFREGDGRSVPFAYVAYSKVDGIIISYQGTNTSDVSSIANDVDLALVPTGALLRDCGISIPALVHDGFQKAWLASSINISASVDAQVRLHPMAPIVVVGHSLGGALAALEYLYVHCRHPDKVIRGITYGMPRVGNYHLADAVDQKAARREGGFFSRVVNGNDIIPHLPLRIPVKNIFGYWHSDGEIWINPANGNKVVKCSGQEDPRCSDSLTFYGAEAHEGTYFGVYLGGPKICPVPYIHDTL
ncbi:alpha/beta-hydrolase [Acaromyces ingoldii]|uniref:Alpha/beta-hydrolase n=1 Tax=Acaromyces ingoldii TaxID=215250 RepID=A0A316YT59_9BASI|nr:alpha/beta-hydrolase [Acaromyces ingoldii]PWN92312.1 alpha/beta-hydrolase [Acaromyces ingoldii]